MWNGMWVMISCENFAVNVCELMYSWTLLLVTTYIQITSFFITDTISGSTTNYSIFYSDISMQNLQVTTCMDDRCEYTADVPSSVCSTMSDVDITVAAANRLGFGQPSEPITIGMYLRTAFFF